SQRGLLVSRQKKMTSSVANEVVFGVKAGQEFDDRRIGFLQAFVENLVLVFGAAPNGDDQVAAVFGHFAAKAPFLLILPLVNQRVLRLLVPQLVEVELLI